MSFFGRNFQLQRAIKKNLPLVERSHTYERVQLVEYYQKILVTYLDHSGNKGGSPLDGVPGGVSHNVSLAYIDGSGAIRTQTAYK